MPLYSLFASPSAAVYYALTGTVFGVLPFVCLQINRLFFKSKTVIALSLILASTGFAAADGVFGGSAP